MGSSWLGLTPVCVQRSGLQLKEPAPPGFPGGGTLGEALLVPTTIYANQLQHLLQAATVKVGFVEGLCHHCCLCACHVRL